MIGNRLKSIIDPSLEVLVLYTEKPDDYKCIVYGDGRYLSVSSMEKDFINEQFKPS